ncbi:MAG: histidine--tRNA ligase [Candidatus Micrarchaeota archaeon]
MAEKKKWQTPRGTRDFLPAEQEARSRIFEKMRGIFRLYGYGEVCTPAFEDFDLLAAKSGPEIENEIYAFDDKSGRKLGLRFDPTVPIARIVASDQSLAKPVKFYYITNMWRYDRPQAGRYREFWQAGLELIGAEGAQADAEILAVASDLLRSATDKDFVFKINSRKVAESLAMKAGISKDKIPAAFRSIDKLSKIGADSVIDEMKSAGIDEKSAEKFVKSTEKTTTDAAPKEYEELQDIIEMAEKMGVSNIEIDFSTVRGIDYYTGFVFETFIKGSEKIGSVCSGGRYDNLIGIYGPNKIPATGFGLGIDRLMDIVGYPEDYQAVKAFVAPAKDELLLRGEAVKIAGLLRAEGVSADTDLTGRPLRKQFDYVNSKNIPYIIIVGERELKGGKFTLRDMKTGKEDKLAMKDIVKKISQ